MHYGGCLTIVTVSIILPTYNRSFTITTYLESLLAQSYHDWELVIMDDASDDDTFKIVSEYAQIDNRIRVFRLKAHSGLPAACNFGIHVSHGRLIFFGEDDVVFHDSNDFNILVNTFIELEKKQSVGAVCPRLRGEGYNWLESVVEIGPISGWIYHNFYYD